MIRAVQLQKRFGRFEALRGVSLQVVQGEVVGLVGPNGAGKTTTLRVLAGLLKPSGGYAEVLGARTDSPEFRRVKRWLAYLPEEVMPYDNLTGRAAKLIQEIGKNGAPFQYLFRGFPLFRRAASHIIYQV